MKRIRRRFLLHEQETICIRCAAEAAVFTGRRRKYSVAATRQAEPAVWVVARTAGFFVGCELL